MNKTISCKGLCAHLKAGTYCGIGVGFIFAFLESVYLLFSVGNFLVDMLFFGQAVLIYGIAGGLGGFMASALLYGLIFRKTILTGNRIVAVYTSFFIGTGIFAELFFYLMDIYPFGGPNKWSLRTLSLVAAAGLLSAVVARVVYRALGKILRRTDWRIFRKWPGLSGVVTLLAVFLLGFSIFGVLRMLEDKEERKIIAAKKAVLSGPFPNVIIILVDALRPDHLSCNGYFLPTSPNIDAMAAGGVLFKSALAASSWSLPTHASLFTGLYPSSHGAYSFFSVLGDEIPTLAGILSENGYYALSLYDNPLLKIAGLNKGFDLAAGVVIDRRVSFTLMRIYQKFVKKDSPANQILELAGKWVEHSARLEVPCFIFMNLFDVHAPYTPKEPYFSEFTKSVNIDQVNMPLIRKLNSVSVKIKDKLDVLSELTETDRSYLLRLYDSNISYEDKLMGNLLRLLKNTGRYDNTLVIVTADHGEYLGEHHCLGHFVKKMYNPGLKIPLIINFPEKVKPGIREGYVSQVDIFPTVLSLIGLKNRIPPEVQGVDLFSEKESRDVIAEFWDDNGNEFTRAIISDNMKLIVDEHEHNQLYDLERDPGEENNLVSVFPGKAEQLRENLKARLGSFIKHESKISERNRTERNKLLESLSYIN
ncbi:MAG: sulfatase-like hydrolase/transferase [PVC group bacterium]